MTRMFCRTTWGVWIIIFLLLFVLNYSPASAQSSSSSSGDTDIEKRIREYEQKLTDLRQQKNTLSSQIQEMDTQIYLKTLTITRTEQKITETQYEIETLSTRIDSLDTSLTHLSHGLINRAVTTYKQPQATMFDLLLSGQGLSGLINRLKYQKTLQDRNVNLLRQVQEAKTNYEEQKLLRETKKKELDQLIATLESQKIALKDQQIAKQNLLRATQNDEATYQSLLEKARAELSGFSAFVQFDGGGLTTFGTGSNGWYFTQRDPSWGSMLLPGSSSNLLLAGCAVTSVAMTCKSFGQDISPASIAGNHSNFIGGDLWNWAFSCSGRSSSGFKYMSKEDIKSYIKNNDARVIIRLIAPSISGLHFVVGFKWDDGADTMIIHDPYYGPDQSFTSRYNWNQISNAIAIY